MTQNVLIIEGSSKERQSTATLTRDAGLAPTSCESVEEAIALCRRSHYDAVVTSDTVLAQKQFTSVRALLECQAPTPIIAVSRSQDPEQRRAAFETGADAVLGPILHPYLFQATLTKCLSQAHEDRDLLPEGSSYRLGGFAEGNTAEFTKPSDVLLYSSDASIVPSIRRLTGAKIELRDNESPRAPHPSQPVDVVVVDQRHCSPEQQSALINFMAKLRARSETRSIFQLIVFGRGYEMQAARALEMGADDVIVGPQTASEIAHRTERLIRRKAMQDVMRKRLRRSLRDALTDPLTGLANRRAIPERLVALSQLRVPLAIYTIDLDHFKAVNDLYGHDVGDEVLIELAQRLMNDIPPQALVARLGGEEFLIALPVADQIEAEEKACDLCGLVSGTPFCSQRLGVTASVGVALCAQPIHQKDDAAHLLKLADEALYRSKANGRNQATLAPTAA